MRPGALFVGALAVFALLGLLVGRGPSSPPSREPERPPATTAQVEHRPRHLARVWARTFAVWNHRSLARRLRGLAQTAAPRLAADLRRGAQAVSRDASLMRDRAGSRGAVVFIRLRGSGRRRRVLVLTREIPYLGSGPDLQGARYRVYEGDLVLEPSGRWRVESWERRP